jgi:hypothetical protein
MFNESIWKKVEGGDLSGVVLVTNKESRWSPGLALTSDRIPEDGSLCNITL